MVWTQELNTKMIVCWYRLMFQYCEQKSSSKSSDSRRFTQMYCNCLWCVVIGAFHFIPHHLPITTQTRALLHLFESATITWLWGWILLRMLKWKSFSGPLFHQDNKITSRYAMITLIIAYHSTHVWLLLFTKIRTEMFRVASFVHSTNKYSHALRQAKTLKLIYLNLIFSKHFYYTMGNILLTNTQRELINKI